MRLLEAVKKSSEYLEKSGIDDPLVDAEFLVFHAMETDRLTAYLENPEIEKDLLSKINGLVRRRARGEPLQYVIGHVDFLGLRINVGKGILIPRPETELLAQEVIATVRSRKKSDIKESPRILDLCTGSGCIALAVAKEIPDAKVYGSDVSKTAIRYARMNAELNNIRNVTFLAGSLFGPVKKNVPFDIIVSNPPYIKTWDISGLQREIREWEPIEALDGGEDGLDFYRKILSDSIRYLRGKGKIIIELGFGQAREVTEIAQGSGFKDITTKKDYAGIERILQAGV